MSKNHMALEVLSLLKRKNDENIQHGRIIGSGKHTFNRGGSIHDR
jgi:hypothetical protein